MSINWRLINWSLSVNCLTFTIRCWHELCINSIGCEGYIGWVYQCFKFFSKRTNIEETKGSQTLWHWRIEISLINTSVLNIWVFSSTLRAGGGGMTCFLGVLQPLWFLNSFCLLFHSVPGRQGEGFDKGASFRAECPQVSHSLYLFPSGARGSFPNDGWATHWSMRIAECG